ncbi:MAG TPA: nitronate monooxygenase [Myxococcaceae bacterium]|nr:nitronate monooxygenase [Myxococcaceae bacterium]
MLEKPLNRAERFCLRFGLKAPILLAPMAGACPPSLSIAVANAGGLGAGGVVMMPPAEILEWVRAVRAQTRGPFQLNNWIPGPPPHRDAAHEARVRAFLARWGPPVPAEDADKALPDFQAQCDAMLQAAPAAVSSIMGMFAPELVERLKKQGIAWFATVTTVEEARQAEAAGADVIVAQGAEAGGHRGSFQSEGAEARLVGLFSLLPCVVDAVRVPVVATGGIADARGVAAALLLGASAVQIGTGFLRCPEAQLHPAWAETLARTLPEQTVITRVFSGRAGRGLATAYVQAAMSPEAPAPAPYPVQRMLTARMRSAAQQEGDLQRMQAWAGQSASLARAVPAGELLADLWGTAQQLLS